MRWRYTKVSHDSMFYKLGSFGVLLTSTSNSAIYARLSTKKCGRTSMECIGQVELHSDGELIYEYHLGKAFLVI